MLRRCLLEWLDGWTGDEKDGKMHTEKKEDLTTPLKSDRKSFGLGVGQRRF